MIDANKTKLETSYYRRLSESQLETLHNASLEVMERTGVRFEDEEAVQILRDGGCEVTDGNRVHIPSWRVEWALNMAPKQIILYDQTGKPSIRLGGRKTFFGNGSDLLRLIDHRTDETREAVMQDVEDIVRVLDALPNYDFVMSGYIPKDVPVDKVEAEQMKVMLENTNKPIVYVTTDMPNAKVDVEMAEVLAGGEEQLRRSPFAACYINIAHPLRHNADSVQKLMYLSRKKLPFVYRPSITTRGLTGPITYPGFLVINNASSLAGLVLAQLTNEGAPFIRCCCPGGTFDMKTMVGLHSGPEIRGFHEDLAHYYNIPSFGLGGSTASKVVDQQAAMEATLGLLTGVLAGGGLLHDVGYMASSTTGSLIQTTICHEIIAWVKEYMKGLEINEETLALDVIHEVGSAGKFLEHEHTYKHFKDDYYPELVDQQLYDVWKELGSKTMKDRAREKVESILAEHQPPERDNKVKQKLQEIVDRV
jgi:trimethylamine--corrinoid protein Co-methyltransferase